MSVYIWRDVYHINFGQADAVVLARCQAEARQLLLDRLNLVAPGGRFPLIYAPDKVIARNPDQIIDGAGVAFLEWEE